MHSVQAAMEQMVPGDLPLKLPAHRRVQALFNPLCLRANPDRLAVLKQATLPHILLACIKKGKEL